MRKIRNESYPLSYILCMILAGTSLWDFFISHNYSPRDWFFIPISIILFPFSSYLLVRYLRGKPVNIPTLKPNTILYPIVNMISIGFIGCIAYSIWQFPILYSSLDIILTLGCIIAILYHIWSIINYFLRNKSANK